MPKKADSIMIERSVHLDANEKAFFTRQLEYIKTSTYDIEYPEYSATRLIPVSTEAGPGATTITYRQYDKVGVSKIIANYADDLPRVDVKGEEFTSPVRSHGNAYGYNVDEIAQAQKAGMNLKSDKAAASRQAYEQLVNQIAWYADGTSAWDKLVGILYTPNIPTVTAHTGAVSGNVQWSGKTVDEILKDLNDNIRAIITLTKGVERPDSIVMGLDNYGLISTTRLGDGSDTTILDFFNRTNPFIRNIEGIFEFDAVDPLPSGAAGPAALMMIYRRDVKKLSLEIPKPYTQLPVERRNLEFIVNTHARIGGVIVPYPLSLRFVEDI